MRIKKSHLRKIIREAVESQYYKDLKQKSSERGEITRSVKDFSKIVIDQVENLVSGIDIPWEPLEKRHQAFVTLKLEINNFFKNIDDEYDKKIRQPRQEKEKENKGSWRHTTPEIDEKSLSPESERYYMDHD